MSEMNPDQIAIINHTDWLAHPVTIQMFLNLEKLKKSFVQSGISDSGNFNIPHEHFRLISYAQKTIDSVITQTKSTSAFVTMGKQ